MLTSFVRFESPVYLWLLLLLPLVIWLSRKSMAGLGRTRQSMAIVLRCLVLAVMVLALAGVQRVRTNDDLTVLFLVDRSDSVPREFHDRAYAFIRDAAEAMGKDDALGVIGFDGRAAIEQLPNSGLQIPFLADPLAPYQTDIAEAVRLGRALLTSETINRLVLLTDGNENTGAVLEEIERFAAAETPVDVVPIKYSHPHEVIFEQLRVPPTASADETVNVRMVLRSQSAEPVKGTIRLYHNDHLVPLGEAGRVTLEPGPQAFNFKRTLQSSGAHRFRAVFEPDEAGSDAIASNNEGQAFTVVSGEGKTLILTTNASAGSAKILEAALLREKLACDVLMAGSLPLTQDVLLSYACVVLDNVPANMLPQEEQEALTTYVRELGGGLIMTGGDESFAAGGWMGSPLESVMPVDFDVKSKRQIPKGALVLVMHACEIPQGNYIGERIAVAAVKTLSSRDLIGVLAWDWMGEEQKNWTVPLQPVGSKTAIINNIRQMSMGDLPDLYPVIKQGVDALAQRDDAAAKHMIVISDFDPMFPLGPGAAGSRLLKKMRDNGISMSTISIGWGGHFIDTKKAKDMAKGAAEGGKYYEPRDYSKLPQIFIKEARTVHRNLFNDTPFVPRATTALSAAAGGLTGVALPELGGHVVTTPKPLADVPLVRDTEEGADPVLAHWQVGLGKSVAFTSGMWDRWGADWAQWERFSGTWAQIVRWASRQSASANFDVSTVVQGDVAKLRIDAVDAGTSAINFLDMRATMVAPNGSVVPVRIKQTGPGRYEGEFDAELSGSYVVNVAYAGGAGEDAMTGSLQTGVSVAYSPEYRELQANEALLGAIIDESGGRELEWDLASSASVFDRSGLRLAETRRPIWEELLRWMLLLFLLDVAVRRIAIDPGRIRRFVAEMGGRRSVGEESAATLSELKGVRGRRQTTSETGPAPTRAARYEAPQSAQQSSEELSKALGGASAMDKPVVAKPTRKPTPTDEGSYTSRLLAAKRRAQQQRKDDE
jgi:Mg-chelatase subunit ChlD/uncharacterized membrane protein